MKKTLLGLLVLLLILSACSPASGPDAAVDQLFEAARKQESQVIKDLIYEKSTALEEEIAYALTFTLENEDPFMQGLKPFLEEAGKKITYSLLEEEIEGDNALIKLEVSYVDSQDYIRDFFTELDKNAQEGEDSELLIYEALEKTRPKNPQVSLVEELEFRLVQEEGLWYFNDIDPIFIDVLTAGLIGAINNLGF